MKVLRNSLSVATPLFGLSLPYSLHWSLFSIYYVSYDVYLIGSQTSVCGYIFISLTRLMFFIIKHLVTYYIICLHSGEKTGYTGNNNIILIKYWLHNNYHTNNNNNNKIMDIYWLGFVVGYCFRFGDRIYYLWANMQTEIKIESKFKLNKQHRKPKE